MLVIRDAWGEVVFEDTCFEKIVEFGLKYKKENNLLTLPIIRKDGGIYTYI